MDVCACNSLVLCVRIQFLIMIQSLMSFDRKRLNSFTYERIDHCSSAECAKNCSLLQSAHNEGRSKHGFIISPAMPK